MTPALDPVNVRNLGDVLKIQETERPSPGFLDARQVPLGSA